MTCYVQNYECPVGTLSLIEEEGRLAAVISQNLLPVVAERYGPPKWQDTAVLKKTRQQLDEYFAGKRRDFDLPLALTGTEFQRKAWQALQKIPYGTTRTYQQQADAIQAPKATRAIGSANGRNRLFIVVPCHRVIGKDGSLTGFAGGLKTKKFLLDFEASKLRGEQ